MSSTCTKLSNTTSMGKNLNFNQVRGRITLLPSLFYSQYALLTTFIILFGRYCFNKLPLGIASAPELFQRRMSAILEGINGVLCQMDDVLIFRANKEEHNSQLAAALK